MTHKKRSTLGSSSTPEYDVSCFCPSCLADSMHQEDHHRNKDARARDDLHRAFGHANIDDARVGNGPSNPHVIPSSI
ncbi:hypothetical protein ZOSMA_7G01770 [Zostera marina]|uniref:Uncharacterized protein n=1 Tax=Zostera marina TaxID=29655 RepID=A0A0K9NQB9_ZOSMR|nr:hypothetical protein ZOSMA_7G01770 [Zostera marina]